ncbi:MAG: SPOR domain-containing protein [Saprospiraceae bacterium]|nr:SPOR domain-containing protein [Saprospiraceae bacterium]
MGTNNMLTYVLYALLGFLLLAAGWKACDMQKEKQRKAAEEAELQQTLRDMGFNNENAEVSGSTYVGDTTAAPNSTSSAKSTTTTGATTPTSTSTTPAKTTTPATKTVTPTAEKSIAAKPSAPATTTAPKLAVKPSTSTQTAKGVAKTATVAGPGSGRWAVRAGTFSSLEGARKRLEQVIKAGYPKAEISKTTNGMSAVVVYRSNDKNAAIRVMDQLEEKGIDAAVFDRSKQ